MIGIQLDLDLLGWVFEGKVILGSGFVFRSIADLLAINLIYTYNLSLLFRFFLALGQVSCPAGFVLF